MYFCTPIAVKTATLLSFESKIAKKTNMNTKKEQNKTEDFAQRFAKAAEELRLTGRQLYRDGIVPNDQVLSKVKKGWQKPTQKAINLFCQKYGVSPDWIFNGVGTILENRNKELGIRINPDDAKPFYEMGVDSCLDTNGQLVPSRNAIPIVFPIVGDVDFWCVNYDKSLIPIIDPEDVIALKKLDSWKEYIPGNFICIFVTKSYKILRKVAIQQGDDQFVSVIQLDDDGTSAVSRIPKSVILEVYRVVGNLHRF